MNCDGHRNCSKTVRHIDGLVQERRNSIEYRYADTRKDMRHLCHKQCTVDGLQSEKIKYLNPRRNDGATCRRRGYMPVASTRVPVASTRVPVASTRVPVASSVDVYHYQSNYEYVV